MTTSIGLRCEYSPCFHLGPGARSPRLCRRMESHRTGARQAVCRLLAVVLGLLAAGIANGAAAAVEEEVEIRLAEAYPGSGNKGELRLRLKRVDGKWAPRVWGRGFNIADHRGRIVKAQDSAAGSRLSIDMMISEEPWQEGGPATYTLDLKRDGDRISGTWTGAFRLNEGGGSVEGTVVAVPPPPPGYARPAPGEHPRLLFRKEDLPALRAKAKTPWGQTMVKRLEGQGKVSWALLYALTGDRAWAEKARAAMAAPENVKRWWRMVHGVHDPGAVATEDAIAFDLIYDMCDETFRAQTLARFQKALPFLFWGHGSAHYNPHDHSNWAIQFRGGVGHAALMLLGEKGDYPPGPWRIPKTAFHFEGFTFPELLGPRAPQIAGIEAQPDFAPGQGVPVVRMGVSPKETPVRAWLVAGPFDVPGGTDALAAIGGEAQARPETGAAVTYRTTAGASSNATFASLDSKYLGRDGVDLNRLCGGSETPCTCCLYAVIENDAPGFFAVSSRIYAQEHACLYIGGRRLADGDCVHLGPGRFPVLVRASLFQPSRGRDANAALDFRLTPLEQAEAERRLAVATESHRILLAEWEAGREEHRRNGGLNPHAEDWIEICRSRCARYADSLGAFGWNMEGEGYSQASFNMLLPIAHAYERAMGRRLSMRDDMYMLLPLYTAKTVFGEDYVCMQGYGPGGGPQGVDNWARGFGTVPDRYRSAALWAWNHTQRLADAGKLKSVFLTIDKLDDLSAAFLFVNYPVDVQERNPAETMSRFCADEERGGYVFRNRWADRDDIVVSLFLNSNCPGGSWRTDECGDFRIAGLGEEWAIQGWGYAHGAGTRSKPRLYMNVLQLSEPVAGRQAVATYAKGYEDGSGVVSMNMDKVYTGLSGGRRPEPVDLGIRGMRSFAVDYSGASGAPCLVAVVDRVSGTKGRNFWQMCTERRHAVTARDNGFLLMSPGGASLNATVAAPRDPRVEAGTFKTGHEANYNYHQGHWEVHFERRNVDVQGGEFFLVVMTLQAGRAPRACVTGKGPDTTVCVGERIVRFDGEKIVFESAARGWRHDGTGIAAEVCPPIRWARRKNLLWTVELPVGNASAPVVSRGRVFMTAPAGTVLCLDGQTGAVLWRKEIEGAGGDGPCLPPAAREGAVYAAFPSGLVAKLDGAGVIKWKADVGQSVTAPPRLAGDALLVRGKRTVALSADDGSQRGDVGPPETDEAALVAGGLRYALTENNELTVADTETGQTVYRQPLAREKEGKGREKQAVLLLAGDLLYACNVGADRRTVIVKPGRAFEKVWEYAVAGEAPAWDAPAFANDRMYIRGGSRLYCVGGETPVLPPPPEAQRIAPAASLKPTDALPIGPLVPGEPFAAWTVVGPFAGRDLERDHLAALGGRTAAVLAAGVSVPVEGGQAPARRLDESHVFKHFKFTEDMRSVDITAALDRKTNATGYFFTAVEVDAPRYVRFALKSPYDMWNTPDKLQARAWLAGQILEEGKLVALEKGSYPLMIQVSIGEYGGDHKIWMAPRFVDETDAYLKSQRAYDETKAWWPEYEAARGKLFVLGE
jgi:hypothetical protein